MSKINNTGVKELRRKQAQERQAKYDALSTEEKLQQIKARPGKSAREYERLVSRGD